MIFRSYAFRRAVLGRHVWLIVPAAGLCWHSQRQTTPSRAASLTPQRPPIIVFSPSEHRLSLIERVWEYVLTAKRFIYLCFLFIPVLVSSPILLVGKSLKGDRWGAIWWYGLLVSRMEAAGPTFIKLAQWAASRADLFPSLLCERLGSLHSSGKSHPFSHTNAVIQSVFRRPFDRVFKSFDPHPIGTGAIAQVYKAILNLDLIPPSYLGPRRNPGSPGSIGPVILQHPLPSVPTAAVAIKVLHPNVEAYINRDLRIMDFFARCINFLPGMEWLSLPEEVQIFGSMMRQQLDLQNEADNLVIFEANFSPRKVPVNFPRPLKVWSGKDVLVEEHVKAVPLEFFLRNRGGPFDEQIATVGLDTFLHMLLLDNFVHADLHPGNILIKFSKPPTTRMLLENIYTYFFTKNPTDEYGNPTSSMIPADYSDSDSIVNRLRSVKDDSEEWHKELALLHEKGYVPEIVLIDAGLVTHLDEKNRQNFLDLFRAIAEFDGYRAGHLMIERSRSPELAVDSETFALKMQNLVLGVKRKTFSLGHIKISDILTQVLKNVQEHHVKMEGDFVNTVISVLLLEGIGRQLDPDLDLFASALPILRKLGGQVAMTSKELPVLLSDLGLIFKFWIWLEARALITSAIVNADELVKYDLLMPSV